MHLDSRLFLGSAFFGDCSIECAVTRLVRPPTSPRHACELVKDVLAPRFELGLKPRFESRHARHYEIQRSHDSEPNPKPSFKPTSPLTLPRPRLTFAVMAVLEVHAYEAAGSDIRTAAAFPHVDPPEWAHDPGRQEGHPFSDKTILNLTRLLP